MSPKTTAIAAGLTAMGLLGPATRCVARQDRAPAPASSPSPSAPAPTVILLSNGQVLRGVLSEDDSGYVLAQKVGPIRLARRNVEGTFPTIEDAYRYQRDRLPKGDPDEHMKLAQWCLKQGLKAEAKEQLGAILAIAEDHRQARAMVAMIDAEQQRKAGRDPEVVRTGGEMPAEAEPRELPAEILPPRSKRTQPLGPPVVFDLPPAVAVRRYQEFAASVHPELQRRCAGCHNEKSEGKFQLMQARSPRAMKDPLLLRNNLDVTLRLIDRADLDKSDLLTSALMPHGKLNQPVLSGPNHPAYRALEHWVRGLQAPGSAPEVGVAPAAAFAPAPPPAQVPPSSGTFAVDRSAPSAPVPSASPAAPAASTPPPGRLVAHPSVPADTDFRTLSPMLGAGPNTAVVAPPARPAAPAPATATATAPQVPAELKPLTAQDLEKMALKRRPPRKLDPALLQKIMTKGPANP